MNKIKAMNGYLLLAGFLIAALLTMPAQLTAQSEDQVDILKREDGRVFLFHTRVIPLSHGFHVHRRHSEGDWERLTATPVIPVQNGFQLQQRLGSEYRFLSSVMPGRDPQSIFLMLRSGTPEALLTALSLPSLSQALGFSWVDEQAPEASQASYRIEIVDDLNRSTGIVLEGSGSLQSVPILPVTTLQVENKGAEIILKWEYHPVNTRGTERVIQFQPRYRMVGDSRIHQVPDRFVLRTTESNTFEYSFNLPVLGGEFEFWIEAADYSGQRSVNNRLVKKTISDNIAPDAITNVRARVEDNTHVIINWPVSTALNVAGYHVFRATADSEEFHKISEEVLEPLTTTFTDSDVKPGDQYRYAVKVLGTNQLLSENSNTPSVSISDMRKPNAVQNLVAMFDRENHAVNLTWENPQQELDGIVYQVTRRSVRPVSVRTVSILDNLSENTRSFTDSGLTGALSEGVTYQYAVIPVRRNGIAGDSLFAQVQIPLMTPPDAPSEVNARVASNLSVAVSWPATTSPSVTAYRLYRSESENDDKTLVLEAGRDTRFFRDEGLPLNSSWMYSVSAVDSVGNESLPVFSESITIRSMTPPQSAFNVQAVQTEGGIQLAWQIRDEATSLSGFNVYVSNIATGVFTKVAEVGTGELRYLHADGKAGDWYKIYPVNLDGTQALQARATQARSR